MIRRSAVMDPERRDLALVDARVEVRGDDDGEKRFYGHAAVFNQRTAIGNPLKYGFYEQIQPGAFTKTLGESDVRFLIDHDPFYVVSRKSAGTLTLREDGIGLAVDAALDSELSYVRDLQANLRNKNVDGMSFGFYVIKDEWTTENRTLDDGTEAEVEVRTIQEVRLIEVSAVTFPAYTQTDASMRDITRALTARGDEAAIRRRLDFIPDLATLLRDDVPSPSEEPGETTPSEDEKREDETEPGETTPSFAPDESTLKRARLREVQFYSRSRVA